MFFFGIKSKSIRKEMLTNIHCDYCDEESDMEYNFSQKYFHLYFIPFIPLRKKTEVCCENCGLTYQNKDITNEIHKKLNRVKERHPIRTPLWAFSGLFLLTLLSCWAFWQSGRHDVDEGNYIADPKKGDVYFLNLTPGMYTTMRVDKADKANVYFTLNDSATSKYTAVFRILPDRYYTSKKATYSRLDIQRLFKKDSILSITRN